ncbi:hypothetical protein L6164_008760 [Bauhinia variegata]|uniref:Uncharacterized protein n=1 Tax=Bauhinia variegata TaxID=167791 RepID=A0ACB9PGW9_BAUVA|nr:hypothetical protein L6164_008760 [Bauhinia variegata]
MPTVNLKNLIGVEKIYQSKLTHVLSLKLLRLTCNQIATLVTYVQLDNAFVFNSIMKATENDIPEFIIGVINANPRLLYTWDSSGGTIFSHEVRFRQAKVFSLIYRPVTKTAFANYLDKSGNSLIHMTGMLESSTQLNRISGAALQMQRELQWFEYITPLGWLESINSNSITARELFTENQKDLRKDGEKWMKSIATSCTIVVALIATIMFATSFTVSGGNNQNTGYPMFQDHKLFKLFIISDAISLFSSTTLLMFLGILTSRYAEDDFLKSLPAKLIIGLSMLFISIATMMITFSTTISVMLPGRLWISIPVILFVSVPVSLFVWLQFPLLVGIYNSTYGPNIFDRDTKLGLELLTKYSIFGSILIYVINTF